MVIYINPTGGLPNGISSFSYQLLEHRSDAHALVLNTDSVPQNTPQPLRSQVTPLPESLSHNPAELASTLTRMIEASPDTEVVIMPNCSDLAWLSTNDFLKSQTGQRLQAQKTIRVLGMIHSDIYTQYADAQRYSAIAPIWIGVSDHCTQTLRSQSPQLAIHTLPYPTFIPQHLEPKPTGRLQLGYVGRLETEQKQIFYLLDLATALKAKGVDFTLHVAGDGPSAADFAQRIADDDLGECVKLLGPCGVDEVRSLLSRLHGFVMVSKYEGFPIALMEAMVHHCCPIVMQIDSGISQLLSNGQNASVTPQGDIDAMAQAIATLNTQRSTMATMATQARQEIAAAYAPEVYFPKFNKIIDQLLNSSAPEPHKSLPDPTSTIIADLVERSKATGQPTVVYGSGVMGRRIIDELLKADIEVLASIDSDPNRAGNAYRRITCHPPHKIIDFPNTNFVIGSSFYAAQIKKTIEEMLPQGNTATITTPQTA